MSIRFWRCNKVELNCTVLWSLQCQLVTCYLVRKQIPGGWLNTDKLSLHVLHLYDYALVSKQAVWGLYFFLLKSHKESSHMVLFQGCQEHVLCSFRCFSYNLLLALLEDKIPFCTNIFMDYSINPLPREGGH